jgi:HlyD family secretion protein
VEQDQLSRDLASLKIDRNPVAAPSGRAGKVVIVLVLAAVAVAGKFYVYPKVHAALNTTEVSLGEVQLISPAQADVQLTATGYVIALTSSKVASKVAGRIAELYVDIGSVMQKGDKVARLDDVDFKSNMAASASRAAAARAKVAIAKAQLAEIKVQIDRETPMVESGVSSKATLADLQTRYDSLTAAVTAAQADAQASQEETEALKTQLGSYTILTPISGTVVNKLVQVGEGVSPGFGTPGVVEVVDMSSLVVEVDAPETRLSQVKVGAPCEIVLDAYASKRWRGEVKEIVQRVNRSKATVPVRVTFVDRPETVLPDMAARVSFLATALDPKQLAAPPKLVVPAAALAQRGGAEVVFVYDDGDVHQRTVEVVDKTGDLREVHAQLPVGTRLILSPPASLADGQKVKEKK